MKRKLKKLRRERDAMRKAIAPKPKNNLTLRDETDWAGTSKTALQLPTRKTSRRSKYRRQLCQTTFLCDTMDGGNFVALFPQYEGKTITFEENKALEIPVAVADYLQAFGHV